MKRSRKGPGPAYVNRVEEAHRRLAIDQLESIWDQINRRLMSLEFRLDELDDQIQSVWRAIDNQDEVGVPWIEVRMRQSTEPRHYLLKRDRIYADLRNKVLKGFKKSGRWVIKKRDARLYARERCRQLGGVYIENPHRIKEDTPDV